MTGWCLIILQLQPAFLQFPFTAVQCGIGTRHHSSRALFWEHTSKSNKAWRSLSISTCKSVGFETYYPYQAGKCIKAGLQLGVGNAHSRDDTSIRPLVSCSLWD